jgi:hypothetical protein
MCFLQDFQTWLKHHHILDTWQCKTIMTLSDKSLEAQFKSFFLQDFPTIFIPSAGEQQCIESGVGGSLATEHCASLIDHNRDKRR